MTKNNKIVVLDDDPLIPVLIENIVNMQVEHFQTMKDIKAALGKWTHTPIAFFIDLHIGNQSLGTDIIPSLRREWPETPIIMITSDPEHTLVRDAINAGANDFIRKPMDPSELIARLHLRIKDEALKHNSHHISFGNTEIDTSHRTVEAHGHQLPLTPLEVGILSCLVAAKGTLVSRDELKKNAWGQTAVTDKAIDRRIGALRKTLKDLGSDLLIKSVYGEGFKL
jgi:DNA-binding response OmpR family regulator